jgi:hypothetical protein
MSFLLLLDPNQNTHSHRNLCRTRVEYGIVKSGVSDPDLDPHESASIYSLGSGSNNRLSAIPGPYPKEQTKAESRSLRLSTDPPTLILHRTRLGSTKTVNAINDHYLV